MSKKDEFLVWAKKREAETGDWMLLGGMENQEDYAREAWAACAAAKDAEIAELRDSVRRAEQSWINWQNRCEFTEQERDEARECVGRLYKALCDIACDQKDFAFVTGETMESAGAALAATPEHLRNA